MDPRRARIGWIDNARGLGIALVVAGHVTTTPAVHDWIFLFHMPLFFALSGALARPVHWRDYAIGRGRALIVPYLAYLPLIGIADLALSRFDGHLPVFAGLGAITVARRLAMGGSEIGGVYGVFWFVPCLFLAGFAFNALLARLGGGWRLAAAGLAAAGVSYLIPRTHDPLGILDVPMAVFAFWVGAAAMNREAAPRLAGVACPILILLFVAAGAIAGPFDMKYLKFGLIPANLIAAAAGTLIVAGVAQWTSRVPVVAPILSTLGRASLVIMFVHQLVHFHLEGELPEPVIMLLALAIPTGLWWLFDRSAWTRRLLLGTERPATHPLRGTDPSLPVAAA